MRTGYQSKSMHRLFRAAGAAFAAFTVATALAVPSADADWGFTEFGASSEAGGQFSRQAGAHADLTTLLRFPLDEQIRNIRVDLPPGLVANPTVTDRCTLQDLIGEGSSGTRCTPTSQVGYVDIEDTPGTANPARVKIYNLVPPPDLPALLGFYYQGVIVRFEPRLRPSDYAISTTVKNTATAQVIAGSIVTLWAVPAETSHARLGIALVPPVYNEEAFPDPAPKLPFLTSPTSCPDQPTPFTGEIESWQGGSDVAEVTGDLEGTPFQWERCDRVPFSPLVELEPGSHAAAAPSGLEVHMHLPQNLDPNGLATAHLREAKVTLPEDVAISPAAAGGQAACSEEQISLGTNQPTSCPPAATIGTLKLKTPLLDQELEGEAILAEPHRNPFGSLLAMYFVIRGPGILIKLPGEIAADPATGRLTTTFEELPQLPFEDLTLSLRGGPQAPLVTPKSCGTYDADVELTSWASSVPVELSAPLTIDRGCATGGFDPTLHAVAGNPVAGEFTPFTLQVLRSESEQNLARIQATLPEGVLAKLAGVPLCPEAAAAAGDCPAASQIGTTTVGAGPGSNPIYVPEAGKAPTAIYIAGPYKGAPYSLVVRVPAQAGPFDLGTVVVRNALRIDPTSAQVTAVSDPLPQILEGIPIGYRDVRVEVTRNEFMLNPTSCETMAVASTLTSAGGATANPSSRFKVAGCGELGFKPALKLSFRGAMKRTGNPALKAVLKAPPGQANIAKTAVLLPSTQFIDNSHINNPCTRVQFNEGACPTGSVLGRATAYTPLLDEPLSGPVYFRSNGGERELPDMVADLDGPIHVTLVGFIDSVQKKGRGRVRTRFQNVPDAPVSKFVLELKGGKKGLIENSVNLCKFAVRATVKMDGQNGKFHDFAAPLATSCGKRGK